MGTTTLLIPLENRVQKCLVPNTLLCKCSAKAITAIGAVSNLSCNFDWKVASCTRVFTALCRAQGDVTSMLEGGDATVLFFVASVVDAVFVFIVFVTAVLSMFLVFVMHHSVALVLTILVVLLVFVPHFVRERGAGVTGMLHCCSYVKGQLFAFNLSSFARSFAASPSGMEGRVLHSLECIAYHARDGVLKYYILPS